jgi:hypothetical protein
MECVSIIMTIIRSVGGTNESSLYDFPNFILESSLISFHSSFGYQILSVFFPSSETTPFSGN